VSGDQSATRSKMHEIDKLVKYVSDK